MPRESIAIRKIAEASKPDLEVAEDTARRVLERWDPRSVESTIATTNTLTALLERLVGDWAEIAELREWITSELAQVQQFAVRSREIEEKARNTTMPYDDV